MTQVLHHLCHPADAGISDVAEARDADAVDIPDKQARNMTERLGSAIRSMTLKPIPLTKYDGLVDSKVFHHFITEGTAFESFVNAIVFINCATVVKICMLCNPSHTLVIFSCF